MAKTPSWMHERDIGKRIRKVREERGMKQRSFAAFGIKQAYLASLEGGVIKSPSPEMISNIAKALNLSVEELVKGTDLASPYGKAKIPQKAFCPNNRCPKLVYNRISTGMRI